MKAVVCLMCIVAVAAKPMAYWGYDNSFENDSLEWLGYSGHVGPTGQATTRTQAQKVSDLTYMLNSGRMDLSDEYMLRSVMNNPQAYANRPYYIDNSGEVEFLPFGVGGSAVGGGVIAAKK